MQRQVFISHAAEDEDWPQDDVEAVAEAIRSAGITVHLDFWLERERKRKLSLDEWRAWMDDALRQSTHVLCLVSPSYQRLWQRPMDEAGGLGVAFEMIRLFHTLYLSKQRGYGRILTLRRDTRNHDCIPTDLLLGCSEYRWVAERELLLSHLKHAELSVSVPLRTTPEPSQCPLMPTQSLAVTPRPATHRLLPTAAKPPIFRRGPSWTSDSGRDNNGHWADLTINGETQRMRWIPPTGPDGFWMGSSPAQRAAIKNQAVREWAHKTEHPPRRELVQTGFWIADTPCTQAFWRAVADIDPSHFSSGADALQRPVESVSWDMVIKEFIAPLATLQCWNHGETVCLPTEVEWEYAARAGTSTAYWWGEEWDVQQGNIDPRGTCPVKRYAHNLWGLYAVHGNVWEWCESEWCERRGVQDPSTDVDSRVVRGGSWFNNPGDARAAYRGKRHYKSADQTVGFRFALRSPKGPEAH
jgi:formylglycine-generating enzyme